MLLQKDGNALNGLAKSRSERSLRRDAALALTLVALVGCQSSGPLPAIAQGSAPIAGDGYRVSMAVPMAAPLPPPAPPVLVATISGLARTFDGKVGIAVRSIDRGWSASANGDIRLPQQSVSKLWVTMTVLDARDAGRLKLDDPVTVTREDLTLFHEPIAAMVRGDGFHTTVDDLIQRAMTTSDNTANDRLLRLVGGPEAVRNFIRRKGLGDIRFGPGERLLQAQTAGLTWQPHFAGGAAFLRARAELPVATRLAAYRNYVADPPDGAAPAAIADAIAKLKSGQLLSPLSSQYLIATMQSSKTGRQRLRGAVPPGWSFGHKTGTGQDLMGRTAGYNDVGFLTAPDGRSYAIAVMIGDTARPIWARQQLMQAVVGAIVADHDGAGWAPAPAVAVR